MKQTVEDRIHSFDKKSKVIKLFNPHKSRDEFGCPPRLCINTYVGCSHKCAYCYNWWMRGFEKPREKKSFKKALNHDVKMVFDYSLENLIVSISNSTDPLQQPLENTFKHTLLSLKTLKENKINVLIISKNPGALLDKEYIKSLDPERTAFEVTIAFYKDRKELEPFAPFIKDRINAVKELINLGFDKFAVRIDPLIPVEIGGQTDSELDLLINAIKNAGVNHVIAKVFRLVGAIQMEYPEFYYQSKEYYKNAGAKWFKNCYMLPFEHRTNLLERINNICLRAGIQLSTCYENVNLPQTIKCDMAESKLGICVKSG